MKPWSSTQDSIALSSGEAEFYGIVKGASIGLGLKGMLADMGICRELEVFTDASAAKGQSEPIIVHSKNNSKIKTDKTSAA